MEPAQPLQEHIRGLEERLLRPEVRRSRELLGELLADEFVEFASDGAAYGKPQVIEALQVEPILHRSLSDFRLAVLAEDVVLSTYRSSRHGDASQQTVESLRSSIWKRREGKWKMIFHQGTTSVRHPGE
jgi:hypothetical protein